MCALWCTANISSNSPSNDARYAFSQKAENASLATPPGLTVHSSLNFTWKGKSFAVEGVD